MLQQHKLAGIMLKKELKTEQKKQTKYKQKQDARVALHHRGDRQEDHFTFNATPRKAIDIHKERP